MTDSTTPVPHSTPARKKSFGRLIFRVVGLLMLLLVVGLIVLYFARNSLVRAGVMRGGQYATDQTTTLDAADLGIFAGTLDLSSLGINNLKGFKEPHLLTMKSCQVSVEPGSLFSDTVVVPMIAISGLEITVEQDGIKNNLADLIEVLKQKTAATGNTSQTSPGKKLKIGRLQLAATKVHIRFSPFNQDFDLGPIQMDDPTNPDGRLPKIADLVAKILIQLSRQIIDSPQLPQQLRDNMKNVTALVDNLKGQLDKESGNLKNLANDLKGAATNPGGAIKDMQNLGNDAGKNLPKNLQNLIPKKDPPK